MEIIKAYLTKNPCYKKATAMTPKGIVVHSTGANNPNLKRYVDCEEKLGKNTNNNTWNRSDAQVCVHAFIGKDKNGNVTVANTLPYNIACWGVGKGSKGSFNYNPTGHIQFEMCEDGLTDKAYCKAVYDKAVEYSAYLCTLYNLDPLGKNVIVSHREAHELGYGSNHGDPNNWWNKFGYTMDGFRKAVKAKMNESTTTNTKSSSEFKVKVIADSLNIRKSASVTSQKMGVITDHGTYTITETKGTVGVTNSWGKLKSGAGWINLYSGYAKKV